MKCFAAEKLGAPILAHFTKGDLLLEGIEEIARNEKIRSGAVISGIGTFDKCVLHMITTTDYPSQDKIVTLRGPIELLSIQGLIADGNPHLHVTVSDTKQAYGGHLEPGSSVLYLAEVCIVPFEGINLTRVPHPQTGVMELGCHE